MSRTENGKPKMQNEESHRPLTTGTSAESSGGTPEASLDQTITSEMPTTSTLRNNDQADVRMEEIEEILGHAAMPLLDRYTLVAEWVRHAEAKASVFEQIVAKPHGGRPEGGISRAARELPIPGKTLLGRRRYIERAIKIDCILPEAKSAARAAGLDNTQCDLLAIAHEHSPEAQLAKVKEIAARRSAPRRKSSKSIQSATADMLPIQQEPVYIPEMTVGGEGTITAEQEAQFTSLRTSWRIDQVLRRQEFEGASAVAQQSFIREELLGNSVIHRKGNDHD